jgi:hypothetical protein
MSTKWGEVCDANTLLTNPGFLFCPQRLPIGCPFTAERNLSFLPCLESTQEKGHPAGVRSCYPLLGAVMEGPVKLGLTYRSARNIMPKSKIARPLNQGVPGGRTPLIRGIGRASSGSQF